jgi:hypothetical protein
MNKNNLLKELPKYFDVGWARFEFKLKKGLVDSEGNALYGQIDFHGGIISLEPSMKGDLAHSTIIHECMHGLLETMGLGALDNSDFLTSTNEILTETGTRAILMFKNLNPKLWELLFETYYE